MTENYPKIQKIIEDIEREFSVKRISSIGPFDTNSDIDFLVTIGCLDEIQSYLIKNGFVIKRTEKVFCAFYYENNKLFFLDFIFEYNQQLFRFGTSYKTLYSAVVWQDADLLRFIKYITNLRGSKKFTDFVKKNFTKYRHALVSDAYTEHPIFREPVSVESVVGFMRRNPKDIVLRLRGRSLRAFLLSYITIRLKSFNAGTVIAFIGVDGVGKTTVIEEMQKVVTCKIVYMGDYYLRFQRFYNWLGSKHLYLARFCFVVQLFEQYTRYIKIRFYTMRGFHVLTDRYPGFNRPLRKQGKLLKLNNALYRLFPQPDGYVLLYGNPEVIYARRQEMSAYEIAVFQSNAKTILQNKQNVALIENTNLDATLSSALDFCLSVHHKKINEKLL